ncbi:hydrolase [Pediococcus inopinatus]|uniref:Hydrolase n=1 Tax=Pediococcus inopinatus TaxID=114090 RepID=A0ABZ0Q475_9LACO|nr:hydrolase [Pediococcus inopinatus]AVL00059.1 hydrolase [Pediococcus inopinatus]KRN61023.1 Isochorismatase hydrolase [Pediococcus inopinatus]WPC19161.1 hydrolase [Pediococcus inopinatus]WPC20953.1 hydrolase [Pediococcus inopinatus]
MTSEARRDPVADKLLTPENSAFLLIDYQPTQINSINSMNRAQLIKNVVNVIGLMNTFKIPVILSTVNVKNGRNKDTIAPIKDLLPDVPSYDRTTINAWEDTEFKAAVKQTGRHNLIIAALWTEACLTFPTLDALDEGYDVFPVVDSVGGTSVIAHEAALRRVEQAGAKPTSIPQLACELQRDWQRTDTVPGFTKELVDAGIFLHL